MCVAMQADKIGRALATRQGVDVYLCISMYMCVVSLNGVCVGGGVIVVMLHTCMIVDVFSRLKGKV